MPRSPDAAEKWIESVCSPGPKPVSKPAVQQAPKSKPKTKVVTSTITETLTINTPGYSSFGADQADFYPYPLLATVYPGKQITIGQSATFSSNPAAHYSRATILGQQAEVHFVPVSSSWDFSDMVIGFGAQFQRLFESPAKILATAAVEYEVSYRVLGASNWQQIPGSLVVKSNTVELLVGAFNFKGDQKTQGALLVGKDCLERRHVFGCNL